MAIDKNLQTNVAANKSKTLILGAMLGALVGLGGAYMLVKNSEREGRPVEISAGEGVRLGLLILGLLRSIATLHE